MDRRKAGIPPPGCRRRGRRVAVTAITSFVVQHSWDVGPRPRNGPPARLACAVATRSAVTRGHPATSLLIVPAVVQPKKRPTCEAAPQYAVGDERARHVILLTKWKPTTMKARWIHCGGRMEIVSRQPASQSSHPL
jgi:hypothetical protein